MIAPVVEAAAAVHLHAVGLVHVGVVVRLTFPMKSATNRVAGVS